MWFGLFRFRSPLLTESRLLSLPVGTEMFHFPTFPPHALCVQAWVTGHDSCRVSPFGNPRIKAQSAAPRGLSQPLTSFIGSWCQGIHRAPLLTWPQRCSRPLCSSQGTGDTRRMVTACPPPARPVRVVRCSMRSDVEGVVKAHSLRTQQRAYVSMRPTLEVPARRALLHGRCTDEGRGVRDELVSVPPLSWPTRQTLVKAAWTRSANRGARCSLERR